VAACVSGSDRWRYRGISDVRKPTPIGHEYVGIVEEGGGAVGLSGVLAVVRELTEGICADAVSAAPALKPANAS